MGAKSFSMYALLCYFDVCDYVSKRYLSELNYTQTVPEDRDCPVESHRGHVLTL